MQLIFFYSKKNTLPKLRGKQWDMGHQFKEVRV